VFKYLRQGNLKTLYRLTRSSLAQQAVVSLILRLISTALGFLSTVLLARLLGAEGYGIYAYAFAIITLLTLPATAGLPKLVVRETSKGLAENRPDLVKGVWQWGRGVSVVLSFVIGLVLGPLLVAWQGGINSMSGQTMAWGLVLVPFLALSDLRGAALQGLKRVVTGQLPEFVLGPVMFLVLIGWVGLTARDWLSASNAMALQAVATFFAFAAGSWLLWRSTPQEIRRAKASAVSNSGWIASVVTFGLLQGFMMINNQGGTVILGLFEPKEAVGQYRVAVRMAQLTAFGLQAVNMVVAPRFAELWALGEQARLQRLATRTSQAALTFNLFVMIAFILIGRSFFRLVFGQDFEAAYAPLLILLIGQLFSTAVGSVGTLLNMTSHEREALIGMGVAVFFNIALNFAFVPVWGTLGSAAAGAVSTIIWNGILWWQVRRRLGVNSLPVNW
jgi:O-antigen/teichoic acid export membrane protein